MYNAFKIKTFFQCNKRRRYLALVPSGIEFRELLKVSSTYSEKDQMLIRNTRVLQHSGDVPSDSQVRQRRSDIKSSRKVKLRGNICMVWGFGFITEVPAVEFLPWIFFLHLKTQQERRYSDPKACNGLKIIGPKKSSEKSKFIKRIF